MAPDYLVSPVPLPSRRKVEAGASQSCHWVPEEGGTDFMALYLRKWTLSEWGSYIRNQPSNTRIKHASCLVFFFVWTQNLWCQVNPDGSGINNGRKLLKRRCSQWTMKTFVKIHELNLKILWASIKIKNLMPPIEWNLVTLAVFFSVFFISWSVKPTRSSDMLISFGYC